MPIKTEVYLQIGLSKDVFKEFKKRENMEDWQQKYTMVLFRGGCTNQVSRLIGKLEALLPLYKDNQSGYRKSLNENIDILYDYDYQPFRLDYIEVYGH